MTRLIWICVLPLLLLAAWLAVDNLQVRRAEQRLAGKELARGLAAAIDQHLLARIQGLTLLAASPLLDERARWPLLYEEARGFRASFGSHVVLADTGTPMQMLLNTRTPFGTALPPLPRPTGNAAAPVALAQLKPAVGDSFVGPISKDLLVAIAVPVLREGQARFVLLTTFEAGNFQDHLDALALPHGWAVSLRDGRGATIARRAPAGLDTTREVDPEDRYIVQSRHSPWSIVVEIPRKLVLAPLISGSLLLAFALLAATLAGVFGGLTASRRLHRDFATLLPSAPAELGTTITEIAAVRHQIDESAGALRDSEARFRAIFDGMLDAVVFADTHRRIRLVNPAFTRLFGYTPEEVAGRDTRFLYADPADFDEQGTRRYGAQAGRDTRAYEMRYRHQDGLEFWAESLGSPITTADGVLLGFIGIHRDISERKRMEETLAASRTAAFAAQEEARLTALARMQEAQTARSHVEMALVALTESRERLQLLIDHAPASLAMFDHDMRYLAVSQRWIDDYGLGQRDLLGHSHYEIFPEIPPAWKEIHQRGLRGEIIRADEDRFARGDGRVLWLRWEVRPWHAADGRIGGIVIFSEDITLVVESRQQIVELNAGLERRVAERTAELSAANAELDAFAYAVSHDLRAPLRAMGGFSQALQEDFREQLAPTARSYLDQIGIAVKRMEQLIAGILALSRTTRGELHRDRVDMSALATRRFEELCAAEPQRRVNWSVEPGLVVTGDAGMLDALLTNLIDNAWKYSAGQAEARITVASGTLGELSGICVSDNGAGFDMAHAGRLFKPFQRLHRQDEFSGIGIGLATARRIALRHGGDIVAEGRAGAGACFCIHLPDEVSP